VDTPLNYTFVCLKDHKGSIIVWIVIIVFGIFSINHKVYMFKAWHESKMFFHVQSTQTCRMDNLYFFKHLFFLSNVHHSFWKLKRILSSMIKSMINCFYDPFEHIWFKSVFDPENYGFWKCGFNKSCSDIYDRWYECIIDMI